jgi:hypothetical protein
MDNVSLTKLKLGGYGISLALKSLEYKTIDDSKLETGSSHSTEGGDEEVAGISFATLKKRKPELTESLNQFKNSLAQQNRVEDLKVWHLKGDKIIKPI